MLTVRDRGWAKKGLPATKVSVNSKGKDIMLMAMIGRDGLFFYQLSDGYNAASFTITMDKIGKQLKEKKGENQHRYLVMDNCPIHNRENLHNLEKIHNFKILYLPPYTPMLNPIQNWFNQIKNVIRTKAYKTRVQLRDSLVMAIVQYKQKNFDNYYRHLTDSLKKGTERKLFVET